VRASALRRRAAAVGIAGSYRDGIGRRVRVPSATLGAVLEALGEAGEATILPPVTASFEPDPVAALLDSECREAVSWRLEGEGEVFAGKIGAVRLEADRGSLRLPLPSLSPGYYRLQVECGPRHARGLLIRAPARAWLPPDLARHRGYGVAVQLYEMLGPGSLGSGDFSDLAGLVAAAGRMGAVTVGVNPLHALFLSAPERASPYSPNSRFALNPLYLDPGALEGLDGWLRGILAAPGWQARVRALNDGNRIDYPAVIREKLGFARTVWNRVRKHDLPAAFEQFRRTCPGGIRDWACYEALAVHYGADYRRWPHELRDPCGAPVERWRSAHRAAVDWYLWLQWQAERQLARVAAAASDAGLAVGLYRDLAVGSDPAGAEAWAGQTDLATDLDIGAPPDRLNPAGQNWGLAPGIPARLLAGSLKPFIELLRSNMRHAGALRIDHVLGLNRLFVIPAGHPARAGTYLRFSFAPLVAALVLESHRARCLVVGEDLGTVPRGLRRRLARRGIFSLRLLLFEHDGYGLPRPPEDYPRDAVAAVGSHDLAPFSGWWRGADLERVDRLGLWPDAKTRQRERAQRQRERERFRAAFVRKNLPGADAAVPVTAAYRWLARTPSRLLLIQPEDALGITEPVNVPGTTAKEPNWRRRRLPPWPRWLTDPRWLALLRAVQEERPPVPPGGPVP